MTISSEQRDDLDQLRRALVALKKARARIDALEQERTEPIALVGIGCRLPGSVNSPAQFWRLLRDGVDAITEIPATRWNARDYFDPRPDVPGKMQAIYGGFVDAIDQFDPHFFGISPREANAMDPQQRLVLQVAWEALEDAGVVPGQLAGTRTGVFIGIGINDYGRIQVTDQEMEPARIDNYFVQGNALCIAANRLSYVLDLQGPSMAIDTACSASLTAIHQASLSLRRGESNLAIVGGVNLMLAPANSIALTKFLAPDGRCKTFDARADGYARGEGVIIVVLKRLTQALADRDSIYAIIRGSAVNQDGFSSGLTVPNGIAQEALLRDALSNAGVEPAQVDYVEAHGTGTALGDPIEANALGAVYGQGRTAGNELLIGSVKTNIGHLESGAGLAGLVKVALALKHNEIPPSLNFEKPNPHIDFDALHLRVATRVTPLPKRDHPNLVGVSSFSFGGANAHAVLQAAPVQPAVEQLDQDRPAHIVTLSAKTRDALREYAVRYTDSLNSDNLPSLANIAYTANTFRSHFAHRLAIVANTTEQLRKELNAFATGQSSAVQVGHIQRAAKPKLAFLFTGQGSQYIGMGKQLYETQPVFRAAMDRCNEILRPLLGANLDLINLKSEIDETGYTQPALFALEYSLAELWRSWGIEPYAVLGHSVGEYVAATIAGVFSLEDGLKLIAARGRLMQALPPGGAMAAVFAEETRVRQAIEPFARTVSLGAINGQTNIVISGAGADVQKILDDLQRDGIKSRRLVVSHAFHSPLMESMLDEFTQVARTVQYSAPRVRLVSNVTGRVMTQVPDAEYWRDHVRAPVQFALGMQTLHGQGCDVFLEIGPSPTLIGMGQRCVNDESATWLHSLRQGKEDWTQMLASLGALYVRGASVDWHSFEREYLPGRQRVTLPTYPFQTERYWFQPASRKQWHVTPTQITNHPLLGERLRSPAIQGEVFQAQIDSEVVSFLADHRVFDKVVFPATGYIEMVLSAARQLLGTNEIALEDISIREALILEPGQTRTMQLVWSRENRFEIYSAGKNDTWVLHATGTVHTHKPELASAALTDAQTACRQEIPIANFYSALDAQGMQFGAQFQNVKQLWCGVNQALGRIQVGDAFVHDAYAVHPVLLDACLQVLGAALSSAQIYLPIQIERLQILAQPGSELWSHALIRSDARGETVTGDVHVFDATGQIVAQLNGVQLKRVARQTLERLLERSHLASVDWLYQINWQAKSLDSIPESQTRGAWLIVADDANGAHLLAHQLQAHGNSTRIAGLSDDLDRIVSEQTWCGVVHWQHRANEIAIGLNSALQLAQALTRQASTARVWFVTRGAQMTNADVTSLNSSTVWGLARTLAMEHPELRPSCIDLDASSFDSDNARMLCAEILAADKEDQIAFRNGARWVARLNTMRAQTEARCLTITARGTLDKLALEPMARRKPAPHQIEIQVRATGVNFRDVLIALGMYPGDDLVFGNECAGTVVAVGDQVRDFQVGDAVLALANNSFASFALADARLAVRKPRSFTFAQAASIPITFLTAHYGLNHLGKMRAGERVLIHAGAGGVGMAAIQLARHAGAEIFATAGSDEKRALLKSLGVQHVLDSRSLAFADDIMRVTNGHGVDLVLNSLADDFIPASFAVLKSNGRFLEIGKRGIWSPEQVAQLGRNHAYHIIYLGEVIERDPGLVQSLLHELMAEFARGTLAPLPVREFSLDHAAEAFRFMAQAKHVGKIVLTQPENQLVRQPNIKSDATYLITGGLGGLGLVVARWLVEQGARYLVLMGRHEPLSTARQAISEIEQAGATITIALGDVADQQTLARVLSAMTMPLRGVIHAAGMLDDGAFAQQTWERFERVLRPKVDGAWNLHDLTQDVPLDFLILFGAGATIIGSAGQTNYAAANAYLDALAHYRQARGLPALSIDWGAWGEVGMAAHLGERMTQLGLGIISPELGTRALRQALALPLAQVVAMPMDVTRFKQAHPALMFADLVGAPSKIESAKPVDTILQRLADAPPNKRKVLVQTHIREQVLRVLGLNPKYDLDPRQPLSELGLDSLMAVELRNALAASFQRALSSTLLFERPTVEALTDFLTQEILPTETLSVGVEKKDVTELAQLSEQEAEALLLQELERGRRNG